MKAHTLFTSLLCAVVMLPLHAAVTDGLTVYYNFDNNSDDSAGSLDGNADTVDDNLSFASGHSGSYGPGLFGGGSYLGSGPGTGHAEAPFSPDVDGGTNGGQVQAITVQWWGKVAQFQTGWQIGVGRGEGGNWRFHRWGENQTMAWQGGGGDIHGGANVNDGQWHHFVGTSDLANNNRTLYIDGVVQASQTMSAINSDPNLPLMIGENPQALNRGWNGEIDDVAIWNRPLSADEVDEIYQGGVAGNSLEDLAGPPTDDDNDTLRDNWELDRTGNLTDLNGTAWDGNGVTPGPGAGTGDFDGDGRSDLQEYDDRTDPTNADSDGDGSSDGEETTAGTDPLNTDSDGDGLLDGVETGTGIFVDANNTGTDPLDIDTDGDNATDGFEVGEGTDPNDAASTPSVPIIQPSFVPINELASGSYGPDFTQRGVNYQENHYGGGVISNNALNNYNVHTSGVPAPTASLDAIEPLTAHGNGGG
ncbi:MAG: LamG domain-containing protein, partial [Actinomycetales bacterium]|nr:LamG domain-containing protein [Actinomycetales bacterium]